MIHKRDRALMILFFAFLAFLLGLAGNEDNKTVGMSRINKEEAAVRHQQDRDDRAAWALFKMEDGGMPCEKR